MIDEDERKSKIKSIRLTPQAVHLIQDECRRRNMSFSTYVRYAAISAIRRSCDEGSGANW